MILTDSEKLRKGILNHGVFFADSNVKGSHIWDLRELLLQDNYAEIAGTLLWKKIKKYQPEVLYGDGYGCAPLMFALQNAARADNYQISVLWAREQRKDRNRKRLIEGPRPKDNARAIYIDDIFSYGSTWSKIHEKLKEENIKIITVALASILDLCRSEGGTRRIFSHGYPVETLFRRHDLGFTRIDAKKLVVKKNLWRFLSKNLGNPRGIQTRIKCPPTIYQNKVFHCTDQGVLYCLDLDSGNILWRYEPVTPYHKEVEVVNELQIFEDKLYYASYDGSCRCVDINTGSVVWQVLTATFQHATPEIDIKNRRLYINAELSIEEYDPASRSFSVKNNASDVSCYNLDNGSLIWRTEKIQGTGPGSVTMINDQMIVVGSNNNSLRCYRSSDGRFLWAVPFVDHIKGKAISFNEKIYAVDELGWFKIIDFYGNVLKTQRVGQRSRHQFLTVANDLGYILITSGTYIHCFDEHGQRIWISRARDTIETRGSLQGNYYMTVGKEKGYLQVNDVRDGSKIQGQHTHLGNVLAPPSWIDKKLAIHSQNKGLFVFETNDIIDNTTEQDDYQIYN